uniref:Uncharacterized protein n=1 Tax=Schistocephalus solidus TaxID=70667 RepID=A0A0X3PRG5_SCHSO
MGMAGNRGSTIPICCIVNFFESCTRKKTCLYADCETKKSIFESRQRNQELYYPITTTLAKPNYKESLGIRKGVQSGNGRIMFRSPQKTSVSPMLQINILAQGK